MIFTNIIFRFRPVRSGRLQRNLSLCVRFGQKITVHLAYILACTRILIWGIVSF